MVNGLPEIIVGTYQGYNIISPQTDRLWGTCIESTKGTPFEPILVTNANQAYQEFKVRTTDAFWELKGQGLYMVRVTAGTPVAAEHTLKDTTAGTAKDVMKITAKQKGSYSIYITCGAGTTEGSDVTISEAGYPIEYYYGVKTIQDLVNRINSDSKIATATFIEAGNNVLATLTNVKLGTGYTVGSDGTVNSGATDGKLADADAPTAHRTGLARLEDVDINGVFCMSSVSAVATEYAIHANEMSSPEAHKWRYGVVGAATGTTKANMLTATDTFDSQNVMYVGQGLIDKNGTEYAPCEATIAIAAKRSALPYYEAIWGGEKKKRLGSASDDEEQFFVDVLPMVNASTLTTKADYREYNEKGVITFRKDFDGIRIKEAILTTQADNTDEEDEEVVMSIVNHAKRAMYNAAFEMMGKTITSTFVTDLEEHIKTYLEVMKNTDLSLIDVPDDNLSAYSLAATLLSRAAQREGRVYVSASITPAHAARKIDIDVSIL